MSPPESTWQTPTVRCYVGVALDGQRAAVSVTLAFDKARRAIDEFLGVRTALDAHAAGVCLALKALRRRAVLEVYVRDRATVDASRDPALNAIAADLAERWRTELAEHQVYLRDVDWLVTLGSRSVDAAGVLESAARTAALLGSRTALL